MCLGGGGAFGVGGQFIFEIFIRNLFDFGSLLQKTKVGEFPFARITIY